MKVRTLIVSDIHLGSRYTKAKEVSKLLSYIKCDTLILNGDIIDGWALKRGGTWKVEDMKCVRTIMKKSKKTKVFWIKGNHDDFLEEFIPFRIGNIEIKRDLFYEGINKKTYFVTHGDMFDVFVNDMKWLAKIGSLGYDLALWLNKWYNKWRNWRGLPYFSLSKKIKDSVKMATSFIGEFETFLISHTKALMCGGVICGHIHCAKIESIDGIEYLNSGDWVESMTALIEDHEGNWRIITYDELLKLKSIPENK